MIFPFLGKNEKSWIKQGQWSNPEGLYYADRRWNGFFVHI